jgi:hypothetical protein
MALSRAGTFKLADRTVHRMGYGAMQLAGPGVFGPPKDHAQAVAVLRAAVEAGVDHIDTCIPIRPILSSSPRSPRGATRTAPGFRRYRPPS